MGPRDKVMVRVLLDGQTQLIYRGSKLKYEPITLSRRAAVERTKRKVIEKRLSKRGKTPSASHPWCLNYKLMWTSSGVR